MKRIAFSNKLGQNKFPHQKNWGFYFLKNSINKFSQNRQKKATISISLSRKS
jgi:hypothetical protein